VELNELIAVDANTGHDSEKCPFCPVDKQKRDLTSVIGKQNNSKTLADSLEAADDRKAAHLYFDVEFEEYRRYSAEAHHLICGNEVLKEEGEVEKYLLHTSRATSKGANGQLEPNDVGYDVNSAKNGIWLPSVPDMFRKPRGGAEPSVWWGDQASWNRKNPSRPPRVSAEEWQKVDAAFIVMEAVKRQFHKGSHGDVGLPFQSYVVMAIDRLRDVKTYLDHYAAHCPMEDDGSPRTGPPFVPPYRLKAVLELLSDALAEELKGHPEEWNYFISEYALQCATWWKNR
jgi:hypothetical protein